MTETERASRRATAHLRRQQAIARRAARAVGRLWGRVDRDHIGPSWERSVPAAMEAVMTAQTAAAVSAGPYLDGLLADYGLEKGAEGGVNAFRFAGVASDGRTLSTLLYQPAITALTGLKQGAAVPRALAAGKFVTDLIVRTQIADAGRVADGVALTARPQLTGWVRMLSLPSCSRCVILAGKRYRWNQGFARHPRCDCRHVPSPEDVGGDLRTDPKAYFRALPLAEQDRVFTPAGAAAIRDGADINRVVNADRGMITAGGRRFTTEATTRLGTGRAVRLMPEQIYVEARGNRDEALRLLRLHGYLM